MRDYLHYVPEFDSLVIFSRKRKRYFRDCWVDGAKGMVLTVFITRGDFGFLHGGN
jgi:hypothetical protein